MSAATSYDPAQATLGVGLRTASLGECTECSLAEETDQPLSARERHIDSAKPPIAPPACSRSARPAACSPSRRPARRGSASAHTRLGGARGWSRRSACQLGERQSATLRHGELARRIGHRRFTNMTSHAHSSAAAHPYARGDHPDLAELGRRSSGLGDPASSSVGMCSRK